MSSLDTNVVLRWLLADVPKQTASVSKLFSQGQKLHAADLVFVEVAYVLELVYEMPREQVIENLRAVMAVSCINCNRSLLDLAIDDYGSRPKLSFADCCLVRYAQLNEAEPLWTFDRKLANQLKGAKLLD